MVVRKTKLQLIFYARDGLFAAVSQAVRTLLMSSACRPQLTLEMLVIGGFFFQRSDTAVFVIWILLHCNYY